MPFPRTPSFFKTCRTTISIAGNLPQSPSPLPQSDRLFSRHHLPIPPRQNAPSAPRCSIRLCEKLAPVSTRYASNAPPRQGKLAKPLQPIQLLPKLQAPKRLSRKHKPSSLQLVSLTTNHLRTQSSLHQPSVNSIRLTVTSNLRTIRSLLLLLQHHCNSLLLSLLNPGFLTLALASPAPTV